MDMLTLTVMAAANPLQPFILAHRGGAPTYCATCMVKNYPNLVLTYPHTEVKPHPDKSGAPCARCSRIMEATWID